MGGLVGMIGLGRSRADARLVDRMSAHLSHRGPDQAGLRRTVNGKAALACRRLACVDHSDAAALPMSNETGDIWLAFDGAIYNHRALRHSLELEGHLFRSRSDAEVVIHSYEQYGLSFLDQLHGIFAIALWDDRLGRLILARDRLGKKPLYYLRQGNGVYFASEIKALLSGPDLPRRIQPDALAQYLTYGFVMPPLTLFDGVRKLGPGEMVIVERQGHLRTIPWWTPCREERKLHAVRSLSAERHAANLRVLLESAVADRLMVDSRFGAVLDGGLESSAVLTMMSRLLGRSVDAAVVVDPQAPGEDLRLAAARAAARGVAAPLAEVPVSQTQAAALLPDYVRHLDEPVADPDAVPAWWTARWFRDNGMIVALSADGAAELLLGHPHYDRYRRMAGWWRLQRRLPGSLKRLSAALMRLSGHAPSPEILRRACEGEPMYQSLETLWPPAEAGGLLAPALAQELARRPGHGAATRMLEEIPKPLWNDSLATMSYVDLRMRLPERVLMRLDKMAMAHGVQVRAPFLDHQLVEYAVAIPGRIRAGLGRQTGLLGRALSEVPGEPAAQLDQPPLLTRWLKGELGDLLQEQCLESRLFADGILSADCCLRLLQEHREGRADHTARLWSVLVLAEWYDSFRVDGVALGEAGQPASQAQAAQ